MPELNLEKIIGKDYPVTQGSTDRKVGPPKGQGLCDGKTRNVGLITSP